MNWHPRKLTYDILIPKLEKNIFSLSEKETAEYFSWYVEQIPERVAYVSKVCARELRIPLEKMDCSPESLLLLWKWFRRRAKTEHVPMQTKQKNKYNNSILTNIWNNPRQLTLETEYILRDIGMYLGETFRENHSNIYWTYYTKPRRDFFVNHPLLQGFAEIVNGEPVPISFEPIHMAGVQAAKLLDNSSRDADLYNLYQWWAERA